MEKFFKVKEHGSTVKTEVLAGITTFMARRIFSWLMQICFQNLALYHIMPFISQQQFQPLSVHF